MEQRIKDFLNDHYPVAIQNVKAVTDEMYQCIGGQEVYFARVTNYKTLEVQLEEVNWTNYMYQHGVGVPVSISSMEGNFVEMILPENILIVLYKAAAGRHLLRSEWDDTILKEVGRQIGRMHKVTLEYERNQPFVHIVDWHQQEEYNFAKYIPQQETKIRSIAQKVLSDIREIPTSESTYGMVHGDIWLENIVVDKGNLITMIDFQDCERHHLVYDIVVPLYSALHYSYVGDGNIGDYTQLILKSLISGYREENDLSPETLREIPLFLKLKEIFEYCLMHMYWDAENLSEEQVHLMNLYRTKIEYEYPVINNFNTIHI
ncbi:phosphotransferase enzyme family protein [Paenibacillus sp. FA6]|uniref:phosphotransferase enzyme family protein n=1 Tax=Paenibacillus sp. FA6 TaxID=3413029 RepID=UPI003F65F4C4